MRTEKFFCECIFFLAGFILVLSPVYSTQSPLVFISNGTIEMGFNTAWGGGIGYFSHMIDVKNVINRFDTGRNIQQSFYGAPGGTYNGLPWTYNPVQGGDSFGNGSSAVITRWGDSAYIKTTPLNWGKNNVPTTDLMEQWVTLRDDVAQIVYRYEYNGTGEFIVLPDGTRVPAIHNQEMPALFFVYDLQNLAYYNGGYQYFTRDQLPINNGPDSGHEENGAVDTPENWAAYITTASTNGWGCGVLFTGTPKIGYYQSFDLPINNSDLSYDTNYFHPLQNFYLPAGFHIQYTCYLKIGNLSDIRTRFLNIKNNGLDLALNGSFEDGSSSNPYEWFIGTDNGGSHTYYKSGGAFVSDGTDSVALTADSNGSTWLYPYWGQTQYGVTGGTKYKISFKAKCEQLNSGTAGIRIIQYRKGGGKISDSGIIAASAVSGTNSTFQSKSFTFTTATNAYIIEIRLQLNSKGDWARVWFDSVKFSLNTP